MKKIKAAMLLGALLMVSGTAIADLNDGLIVHYSFDDCTAKDSSANALDGTIIGDPKCVDGIALDGTTNNKALEFNGNDVIERLFSGNPAAHYTVSVWLKATDNNSGIFSVDAGVTGGGTAGNDRHIYLSSGRICHRVWSMNKKDQNGDGSTQYISCTDQTIGNGFTLVTLAVTGKSTRYYINGELVKQSLSRPSEFNWDNRFYVGYSYDRASQKFKGVLDEFRYYRRALKTIEIKELYKQGITVAGTMKGLNPVGFSAECQNVTTGQSVMLTTRHFNCEAAGLTVSPNDVIHITVDGKAK